MEQGDNVAVEYQSSATNSGPLPLATGELPATNKQIAVKAASIATVDGSGRIKTQREYVDQVEILAQLGLMPLPAGATA
jgi:hypothetical protein